MYNDHEWRMFQEWKAIESIIIKLVGGKKIEVRIVDVQICLGKVLVGHLLYVRTLQIEVNLTA